MAQDSNDLQREPCYRECVVTVMDTSDPDIRFDDAGICKPAHDFATSAGPANGSCARDEPSVAEILVLMALSGNLKQPATLSSSKQRDSFAEKWPLRSILCVACRKNRSGGSK